MTALNNEDVLSLIGLGIVSTAFGFSGFYLLIKRAGARVRDNRGCGFSSEKIDGLQITGIILVLLGIFIINKPKFDTRRKHS